MKKNSTVVHTYIEVPPKLVFPQRCPFQRAPCNIFELWSCYFVSPFLTHVQFDDVISFFCYDCAYARVKPSTWPCAHLYLKWIHKFLAKYYEYVVLFWSCRMQLIVFTWSEVFFNFNTLAMYHFFCISAIVVNRCFVGVFVFSIGCWIFCWYMYKGFRHTTESDPVLFHFTLTSQNTKLIMIEWFWCSIRYHKYSTWIIIRFNDGPRGVHYCMLLCLFLIFFFLNDLMRTALTRR